MTYNCMKRKSNDVFTAKYDSRSNMADKRDGENMSGQLSSDILRGHTDTIVLACLLDRDRYGFEIYNRVLEKTNQFQL